MIRKSWDEDKWLLTPQMEHARLAGLIAASWNFPHEKPHEEVILAISRHDDGWNDADKKPSVSPAGCPMSFDECDPLQAMNYWAASSRALFDERKYYAARLVAGHFYHRACCIDLAKFSPRAAVTVGKFMGEEANLMKRAEKQSAFLRTLEKAAITEDDLMQEGSTWKFSRRENYDTDLRFLQVCDQISLLLLTDFIGDFEINDVPYLPDADQLVVSRYEERVQLSVNPLPFKKNLRHTINVRIVPRKIYESSEELQGLYDLTKPTEVEVHIGSGNARNQKSEVG